jgi:hypothetical protein
VDGCSFHFSKNSLTGIINLRVDQSCQQKLDEIYSNRTTNIKCKYCKNNNITSKCTIDEILIQAPPFLIFDNNKKRSPDNLIILNKKISYELVSALYNTGGHFVAYSKFPDLKNVKAGLYKYNDLDGKAQEVCTFEFKIIPVMLIYKSTVQ